MMFSAGQRTAPEYRPYAEYEEALEAVAPEINTVGLKVTFI
jgi:hypothetical protein